MADSNFTPAVRPCVKCGASDRYSGGDCRPCRVARDKLNREKNPEKLVLQRAEHWAKNSEKLKEQAALSRKRNVEKIRERNFAYRKDNVDRIKVAKATYYEKNKEKVRKKSVKWRAENPEALKSANDRSYKRNHLKIKAAAAAWSLANTDKIKATSAKFRKDHPELRVIWEHNRRAKKLASGGTLSKGLTAKLLTLQKGKCACCHLPLGDDFHMDHVMPLALGGSNTDDNMQLLRKRCNAQKGMKHPIDFMQSRGFLL